MTLSPHSAFCVPPLSGLAFVHVSVYAPICRSASLRIYHFPHVLFDPHLFPACKSAIVRTFERWHSQATEQPNHRTAELPVRPIVMMPTIDMHLVTPDLVENVPAHLRGGGAVTLPLAPPPTGRFDDRTTGFRSNIDARFFFGIIRLLNCRSAGCKAPWRGALPADVAQSAEHPPCKRAVTSSILVVGSKSVVG